MTRENHDMTTRNRFQRGGVQRGALMVVGAVMLGGLVSALPSVAADPPAPGAVTIAEYAFAPPTITIAVGQSVTWVNRDETPHQVVSATKRFRSPGLDTGDAFTFAFTEAGTYPYYCGLHPRMTGTVVVH
jgi:plastocyanin